MVFEVTTLGTGAALPARGRYPSAQLVNVHGRLYLVDCGEGTQERLRQARVNFSAIDRILISHLHGDHYLGLMGLISSMHLQGRTRELHVHGPAELREVIEVQLRVSRTWLRFPLGIHTVEPVSGTPVFQTAQVTVTALELKHRIPTAGFVFREAALPRRLKPHRVTGIPMHARARVKAGEDLVLPDGTRIPNAELTEAPPLQRAYAYCSDTAYAPELATYLQGVDLLYHEATFTEELTARAKETQHSTARQAAHLAKAAGVARLLLGHFSSRYKDVTVLLHEAREIFPDTELAGEGLVFRIDQRSPVQRSAEEDTLP